MPGYPFSFAFNAPECDALDWGILEEVSKLSFTDDQRQVLLKELNRYIETATWQHHLPQKRLVQRRIQSIQRHTKALTSVLSPSGGSSDEWILLQAALDKVFPLQRVDSDTFVQLLYALTLSTEAAIRELQQDRPLGPPRKYGLPLLIRQWHAIYRQAGGTGHGCAWAYSSGRFEGPFLELLATALSLASTQLSLPDGFLYATKDGLGQMIVRSLRSSGKTPTKS